MSYVSCCAIFAQHARWLVEDFMSLLPLRMAPKSLTPLGVVDVTYTQELSLMNFIENRCVFVSVCIHVCIVCAFVRYVC